MDNLHDIRKKCIKDLSITDLSELMIEWGEQRYRAEQIYNSIYAQRVNSFDGFSNIPAALRDKLEKEFVLESMAGLEFQKSADGTIKFLFDLVNGNSVESVLIPSYETSDTELKRLTLCVSSQVGCALDCSFCATGKLKFSRNLTSSEIVDQILNVEKITSNKITNIVFMGMGEPLQNFDNVMKAIDILTNIKSQVISRKRITLSTSGIVPKIIALADLERPVKLAVSLHATTDKIRSMLMPVNNKWKIKQLREAIEYYYRKTKIPVTYEYILFDGLNDSDEDVSRLAKFVRSVPSKINIIPFHDISFTHPNDFATSLKPASMSKILDFVNDLRTAGVNAFVRTSSGFDIDAACGQLAFSKRKQDGAEQ